MPKAVLVGGPLDGLKRDTNPGSDFIWAEGTKNKFRVFKLGDEQRHLYKLITAWSGGEYIAFLYAGDTHTRCEGCGGYVLTATGCESCQMCGHVLT